MFKAAPCLKLQRNKTAVNVELMEQLNPDQSLTESLLSAILLSLFCVACIVLNIYSTVLMSGSVT